MLCYAVSLDALHLFRLTLSFQHKPPATLWGRSPQCSTGHLPPSWRCEARQGRKKKQMDRKAELSSLTESTVGATKGFRRVFFYPVVFLHAPAVALTVVSLCWLQTARSKQTGQKTVTKRMLLGGWIEVMPKVKYVRVRIYLDWLGEGAMRHV